MNSVPEFVYCVNITLWANSAADKLIIFSPENRIRHFMQIVSSGNEMGVGGGGEVGSSGENYTQRVLNTNYWLNFSSYANCIIPGHN